MNPAPRAWLLRDGAWHSSPALPVTDRGVRYGMAVFETLGLREGSPLFLTEHLARLGEGARHLLGAGAAPSFRNVPEFGPEDTGILRLYITAGDGAPGDPVIRPRTFALFENLPASGTPDEQTARLHPEPVALFGHGRKTANYWTHCAVQDTARDGGFDHALLADHDGRILSGAFGNLFFVAGGRLCTPATSLSVRPGVIRSWVMARHDVEEVEWPAGRLHEASELFLTNSRLGVMPIRFGPIGPGPVGCALRDDGRREKITP